MGPKFYSETKVSPLVCQCQLSIFLQVTFLLSTPFCLTSPVFRVIYCRTIVTSPRSNDTVMISELKPVTLELLLYGLSGSPDWNPERRVASGEADVSTSRPMNRILCEDFSTITYMKGWSALNAGGASICPRSATITAVAAAASIPGEKTSFNLRPKNSGTWSHSFCSEVKHITQLFWLEKIPWLRHLPHNCLLRLKTNVLMRVHLMVVCSVSWSALVRGPNCQPRQHELPSVHGSVVDNSKKEHAFLCQDIPNDAHCMGRKVSSSMLMGLHGNWGSLPASLTSMNALCRTSDTNRSPGPPPIPVKSASENGLFKIQFWAAANFSVMRIQLALIWDPAWCWKTPNFFSQPVWSVILRMHVLSLETRKSRIYIVVLRFIYWGKEELKITQRDRKLIHTHCWRHPLFQAAAKQASVLSGIPL